MTTAPRYWYRVEFAVAMPRYQYLGAVVILGLDEGGQKMLAMPEREDQRLVRLGPFVDVGRIEAEFVGAPDQPQISRDQRADRQLEPAGAQQHAQQFFQRAGFAACAGSSSR